MERLKFSWHKAKPQKMEQRQRSDDRYHTRRWQKLSKMIRERDVFCQECLKVGKYSKAEVCDHVIPIAKHPDFWDVKNLQGLCKKCNIIKGNKDKKI